MCVIMFRNVHVVLFVIPGLSFGSGKETLMFCYKDEAMNILVHSPAVTKLQKL